FHACCLFILFSSSVSLRVLHSSPTRRSSDLRSSDSAGPKSGRCSLRSARVPEASMLPASSAVAKSVPPVTRPNHTSAEVSTTFRSEEHTSELQSRFDLVCRLLLEKKKKRKDR